MRLRSTFGMTEMEQAAEKILEQYNATGSNTAFIWDFASDYHLLLGFSELIAFGWLDSYAEPPTALSPVTPKGLWCATPAFFDRIRTHHPEAITR